MKSQDSEFVQELRRVLKLPEETRAFAIKVEVDRPVMVECEFYANDDTGKLEIKRYKLTKEEIIEMNGAE